MSYPETVWTPYSLFGIYTITTGASGYGEGGYGEGPYGGGPSSTTVTGTLTTWTPYEVK